MIHEKYGYVTREIPPYHLTDQQVDELSEALVVFSDAKDLQPGAYCYIDSIKVVLVHEGGECKTLQSG